MTVTLPLDLREQAKLTAIAHARGLSADGLVREAVDRILANAPDATKGPTRSARGLPAKYRPAPSAEE